METDPIPLGKLFDILLLFDPTAAASPLVPALTSLGIIVLLLACSALLSGSEVAFFSITHNDIEKLRKNNAKNNSKSRILRLLERPHFLLSTILISNNFVNIGIILTSNYFFDLILVLPEGVFYEWVSFAVTVILVTFLLVLFGEVAPKVYASANNMRLSKMMARPLLFLRACFYPVSWILVNATRIIERRLNKRMSKGSLNIVTDKDIEQAIELTVGDTKYAEQDIGLLKSIIQFGNTNVKNIMCARVDVEAVDVSISFKELIAILTESNYSRIPVYEENFDKVVGIIHTKDLIEHFDKAEHFDWKPLLRIPFFIPENKKIDDLFNEFQVRRTHMAIVVDEYGGTSGIVTLEDVLEEIVGEINDEFDEPEDLGYSLISEGIYLFEGKTSINDLCRVLKLDSKYFDERRGGAETIAGLVLVLNGQMPKKNTTLMYKGFSFTVVSSSERRIESIKVTAANPAKNTAK